MGEEGRYDGYVRGLRTLLYSGCDIIYGVMREHEASHL